MEAFVLTEKFSQFNVHSPQSMQIFSHEVKPEGYIILLNELLSLNVEFMKQLIIVVATSINENFDELEFDLLW